MIRSSLLLTLLAALALLVGCDETAPEAEPAEGGANPAYAGRFVGTWAEEDPEANFIITLFLAPEQGQMVGTGSVTRRLVLGGGFQETSYPLTLNGQVAELGEQPTVHVNAHLPTGHLVIVRGTGNGGQSIRGSLSGATPYGAHTVDEITLARE